VKSLTFHVLSKTKEVSQVIERCLAIVTRHRDQGSLLDNDGKIANEVLVDLGDAGYWGLLVDKEYGGSGASIQQFAKMITRLAMIDPKVAGLASVHGCIGAVDLVRTFWTAEQKQRFPPKLADGTKLSAFALTEPVAGSDLTALKTVAVRDGNDYLVSGEKRFITTPSWVGRSAWCARSMGCQVCLWSICPSMRRSLSS
jgi:alkylation response protein AidB-like acyl-CoA dehydrogenase